MTEQELLTRLGCNPWGERLRDSLVDYFRSIGWHNVAREIESAIDDDGPDDWEDH